jgi:hypothetical protein
MQRDKNAVSDRAPTGAPAEPDMSSPRAPIALGSHMAPLKFELETRGDGSPQIGAAWLRPSRIQRSCLLIGAKGTCSIADWSMKPPRGQVMPEKFESRGGPVRPATSGPAPDPVEM